MNGSMVRSRTSNRKTLYSLVAVGLVGSVAILQLISSPTSSNRGLQQEQHPIIPTNRGFGTHYVTLYVGNPAQEQRLAISTSSDFTTFRCEGCQSCGTQQAKNSCFVPTRSSQIASCPDECVTPEAKCDQGTNQCAVVINYYHPTDELSGGYKGYEVVDYAYMDVLPSVVSSAAPSIAKNQGFPLNFQCQKQVTGSFAHSVTDGVAGMSTAPTSFINQMFVQGKLTQRMFALCFRSFPNLQEEGTSAGTVTLGGFDRSHHATPLVWARNTATHKSAAPFAVHIRRIYLAVGGGQDDVLVRANEGAITMLPLDTEPLHIDGTDANAGTTTPQLDYSALNGQSGEVLIQTNMPDTCLDKGVESAFFAAFTAITGLQYAEKGISMTLAQFKQLPAIVLQLEAKVATTVDSHIPGLAGKYDPLNPSDILLAIPPTHYLLYDASIGVATPLVVFHDTRGSRLGANVLQGHELVFDLDREKIGFAERPDCPEGLSLIRPSTSEQKGAETSAFSASSSTANAVHITTSQPKGSTVTTDATNVPPPEDVPPDILMQYTNNATNGLSGELDEGGMSEQNSNTSLSNTGNGGGGSISDGEETSGGESTSSPSGGGGGSSSSGGGGEETSMEEVSQGETSQESSTSGGSGSGKQPVLGLPRATGSDEPAFRIGPGVVDSEEALGGSSTTGGNGFWNLIGFAAFFLGFFITVMATRDSEGNSRRDKTFFGRSTQGDDDFTYNGGKSIMKGRGKGDKSVSSRYLKQGGAKQKWVGKYPPTQHPSDRTTYTRDAPSVYTQDDRSYYTRGGNQSHFPTDDRSYYTSSEDRSYFTTDERSYYSRNSEYYPSKAGSAQSYNPSQGGNSRKAHPTLDSGDDGSASSEEASFFA